METFCAKMKRLGYSQRQQAEIIVAGKTGHKRKMAGRRQRHRKGEETEKTRRLKKLTGKTSWYKERKQKHTKENQGKKMNKEKGPKGEKRQQETEKRPPHLSYSLTGHSKVSLQKD